MFTSAIALAVVLAAQPRAWNSLEHHALATRISCGDYGFKTVSETEASQLAYINSEEIPVSRRF